MGEELLCNGGSWWFNPERSSLSCSSTATEFSEAKTHQSCDESAGSVCGSSITFQETPSSSSMSWTKVLLSGGGADQTLNNMFQDHELGSRTADHNYVESSNPFGGMSKSFLLDSELSSLGRMQQPPWPSFSQLLSSSLSSSNQLQQPPNYRPSLQFTNNTPWWNPSASCSATTDHVTKPPPTRSKSAIFQSLEQPKTSPPVIRESPSSSSKKTASEAPATKRPRAAEAPPPQPTFKVRKEKLGDRITALQQLVSPFGKTDTASVLQEAIDYIKFLHEQVSVLSSPYLKEGRPMKQREMFEPTNDCGEAKQELRSRGLCLVPITGTYPVASDQTTADLGHPTFGGASFRLGELRSCSSLNSEKE